MKSMYEHLFLCFVGICLFGCAAMLVPETKDPHSKLYWATELFDKQYRPLPAERLIQEAMLIYQNENNRHGLADVYRTYGFFFESAGVQKWEIYYRKNGFMDKTATFENRYKKAIEFFEKARDIYQELNQYDALTNVNLNIGFTNQVIKSDENACKAFNQSIKNYHDNIQANPKANVQVPTGYNNFEEFVKAYKKKSNCDLDNNWDGCTSSLIR